MCNVRFLLRFFSFGLLAGFLAACAGTGKMPAPPDDSGLPGQIANPASAEKITAIERADPITQANFWAMEYQKDATSLVTTVRFLRALRELGSHERVAEVASTALSVHPDSHEIYLELARSLLSSGKLIQANQTFGRAVELAPDEAAAPLAGLGLSFDRMEEHDKAQKAYAAALQREPNRVSTLSNYAMSLVLTGQLDAAEVLLRRAVDLPGATVRVRQNLALILGLQGRYDEMLTVDPSAPRRISEANRDTLRSIVRPDPDFQVFEKFDPGKTDAVFPDTRSMPDTGDPAAGDEALPESEAEEDQRDESDEKPAKPGLKLRGSQSR